MGAPGSGAPLGSTSLSLLHLGHHVNRAIARVISNVFQSHLVESILVPSHLYKILVL